MNISSLSSSLDFTPFLEFAKLVVPAIGAAFLAWMASRKDRRESEDKQQDRLTTTISDVTAQMTTQSREMIASLQREIGLLRVRETRTEKRAERAEEEVRKLKQQTEKLELECKGLQDELDKLRVLFEEMEKNYTKARKELESRTK